MGCGHLLAAVVSCILLDGCTSLKVDPKLGGLLQPSDRALPTTGAQTRGGQQNNARGDEGSVPSEGVGHITLESLAGTVRPGVGVGTEDSETGVWVSGGVKADRVYAGTINNPLPEEVDDDTLFQGIDTGKASNVNLEEDPHDPKYMRGNTEGDGAPNEDDPHDPTTQYALGSGGGTTMYSMLDVDLRKEDGKSIGSTGDEDKFDYFEDVIEHSGDELVLMQKLMNPELPREERSKLVSTMIDKNFQEGAGSFGNAEMPPEAKSFLILLKDKLKLPRYAKSRQELTDAMVDYTSESANSAKRPIDETVDDPVSEVQSEEFSVHHDYMQKLISIARNTGLEGVEHFEKYVQDDLNKMRQMLSNSENPVQQQNQIPTIQEDTQISHSEPQRSRFRQVKQSEGETPRSRSPGISQNKFPPKHPSGENSLLGFVPLDGGNTRKLLSNNLDRSQQSSLIELASTAETHSMANLSLAGPKPAPIDQDTCKRDNFIPNGDGGGWGGLCQCPGGGKYWVGDNWNGCGSLACENGMSLSCNRWSSPKWKFAKVTCCLKGIKMGRAGTMAGPRGTLNMATHIKVSSGDGLKAQLNGNQCWRPSINNKNQYIRLDIGQNVNITGVMLQNNPNRWGRGGYQDQYVSKIRVETSYNGVDNSYLTTLRPGRGHYTYNFLLPLRETRFLKLIVKDWHLIRHCWWHWFWRRCRWIDPGYCIRFDAKYVYTMGPDGIDGKNGKKGLTGKVGAVGPKGYLGARGESGEKGQKGVTGNTGPQGPPGPRGNDGQKGDAGLMGEIGEIGAGGVQGPIGDEGNLGPMGKTGKEGSPSDEGPKGADGRTGEPGNPGLKGQRGKKGEPGLNGVDGKPGVIGPPGPSGEPGLDGREGLVGPKGPRGLPGVAFDGKNGKDGKKGNSGANPGGANLGLIKKLEERLFRVAKKLAKGVKRMKENTNLIKVGPVDLMQQDALTVIQGDMDELGQWIVDRRSGELPLAPPNDPAQTDVHTGVPLDGSVNPFVEGLTGAVQEDGAGKHDDGVRTTPHTHFARKPTQEEARMDAANEDEIIGIEPDARTRSGETSDSDTTALFPQTDDNFMGAQG